MTTTESYEGFQNGVSLREYGNAARSHKSVCTDQLAVYTDQTGGARDVLIAVLRRELPCAG